MIRRLFCYIEYNEIKKSDEFNPDNYDLIEIGASLYVDDEEVKSYARFVRPQHFELMTKERYLSFGGLKESDLQQAEALEDISRRFYKTFYEYDLLIMWSREDYEILMINLIKGGHIQAEHKAIFLKDLIQITNGYCKSFIKELKYYNVKVEDRYNLHYSKFKVRYLAKLYFAAKKSYSVFLKKEGIIHVRSKYGNVIHNVECDIARRIPVKNIIEASRADFFDGISLCKRCCQGKMRLLPDKEHIRFSSKYQFDEFQVAKMCAEFGMEYQIAEGIIFINTKMSSWRLFHDNVLVTKVYHENLRMDDYENTGREKRDFEKGYHRQRVYSRNLYDVLYYIHVHDRDMLKEK